MLPSADCRASPQFPHKGVIRKHTKEETSTVPKHQLLIMKTNRKRKIELEEIKVSKDHNSITDKLTVRSKIYSLLTPLKPSWGD
jgi:hypothetical protein